jgi:arsenite methyltransferase
MDQSEIRRAVREHYAGAARAASSCCGGGSPSPCCSGQGAVEEQARLVGYSRAELDAVPDAANLGLGCGNPTALAELKEGEVVVDLGSGAGIDCFLASGKVGLTGRVIGVDMTPEMLERSRRTAREHEFGNVEFRLGEIEALPVADNTADVVISNCVINLSTDKPRVFGEALRVLKPGGRLMVSDLTLRRSLPESVRSSLDAYAGCISGAMLKDDYLAAISEAGFVDVAVVSEATYPIGSSSPDASGLALLGLADVAPEDVRAAAEAVVSVKVRASKLGGR